MKRITAIKATRIVSFFFVSFNIFCAITDFIGLELDVSVIFIFFPFGYRPYIFDIVSTINIIIGILLFYQNNMARRFLLVWQSCLLILALLTSFHVALTFPVFSSNAGRLDFLNYLFWNTSLPIFLLIFFSRKPIAEVFQSEKNRAKLLFFLIAVTISVFMAMAYVKYIKPHLIKTSPYVKIVFQDKIILKEIDFMGAKYVLEDRPRTAMECATGWHEKESLVCLEQRFFNKDTDNKVSIQCDLFDSKQSAVNAIRAQQVKLLQSDIEETLLFLGRGDKLFATRNAFVITINCWGWGNEQFSELLPHMKRIIKVLLEKENNLLIKAQ